MAESRGHFGVLSRDLLKLIFIYYLPLADVVNAKRWNKEFRELLAGCDELLWQKRLDWHFPIMATGVPSFDKNQTALDKFNMVYEREYKSLKPRQRKIISLLKENNVAALKQMILTQQDIGFMLDATNNVNICLVKRMQSTTRKYLFDNVVTKNLSQDEKKIRFLWAILLMQHESAKDSMVDEQCLAARYHNKSGNDSPKHFAAMAGDIETHEHLTMYDPANPMLTPMQDSIISRAARYGHTEFVKGMLVEQQGDEKILADNTKAAALTSVTYGHVDCLEFLLENYFRNMKLERMFEHIDELIGFACAHQQVAVVEKIFSWRRQLIKSDSSASREVALWHQTVISESAYEKLQYLIRIDKSMNVKLIQLLLNEIHANDSSLFEPFRDAVSKSDINVDVILLFIEKGMRFNIVHRHHKDDVLEKKLCTNLLITAIQKNSFVLFEKVYHDKWYISFNALCVENKILDLACQHGRKDIVEFLIKNKIPIENNEPLKTALAHGHVEVVELLRKNGVKADFDERELNDLFEKICTNGAVSSLYFLRKEFPDQWKERIVSRFFDDLVRDAKGAGRDKVVEYFVQDVDDPEDVGQVVTSALGEGWVIHRALDVGPVLFSALEEGNVAIVKLFGDKYKDSYKWLRQENTSKKMLASAREMNVDKMKALLLVGANVNARDDDSSDALIIVSRNDSMDAKIKLDAARFLIEAGISVSTQDKHGNTALYYAANNGDADLCRLLLENGADINAINKHGVTAFDRLIFQSSFDYEKFHVVLEVFCQHVSRQPDVDQFIARMPKKSYQNIIALFERFGLLIDIPPVLSAALNHKVDEVRKLVAANADINETYKGVTCLIFALRSNLLAEACAMVKLNLDEVTQAKYDAEFKKKAANNLHMRQLLVMEVVLLNRYINKRGAPDAPERMTLFRTKKGIEIGDTKTNKVPAAKKRLRQLLGDEVNYTPVDIKALTKGELGDISKFSRRM